MNVTKKKKKEKCWKKKKTERKKKKGRYKGLNGDNQWLMVELVM